MYARASTALGMVLSDDELVEVVGGGEYVGCLGSGYVGDGINVGQLGTGACYICGHSGGFSVIGYGGNTRVSAFNNYTTNNGNL